jgi:hypothetical protein
MQMDMMGMRAKAAADASMKAQKAQQDKDLLAIKPGDADYFQEIYNNQYISPAIQKLLTLKQQGILSESGKLAVTGDLDAKAKQYKVLADETRSAVANSMKGMENVYDPGELLNFVKQKQYQRFLAKDKEGKLAPEQYLQTDIQADVDEGKKQLKSLQQGNINNAFVKLANERKNKVQVQNDPTGLYKTGDTVEAQAYWQVDPKTANITGFDFNGFYGDYTAPGTPTQQLYEANRAEKLSDPNFKKQYDETVGRLTTLYSSDPAKLQSSMNKYNAEKFILPYFGEGKRWEDFFYKNISTERIRQFVKPTERELEEKDASYLGSPETEVVLQTGTTGAAGAQGAYQTTVKGLLTKDQANQLLPDASQARVQDRFGRVVAGNVKNISKGSSQEYSIVARTNLNSNGLILTKNGKPVALTSLPKQEYDYLKKNGLIGKNGNFLAGQEMSIPVAQKFMNAAKANGYEVQAKGRSGVMVPIDNLKDVFDVPGAVENTAYYQITVAEGQEKTQGTPSPIWDPNTNKIGMSSVNINIGGPGMPKAIYYSVNQPSAIKTMVQKNVGVKELNERIEQAKKKQYQAMLSAMQGNQATAPASQTQGQQQTSAPIDFNLGE